MGWFLLNCCLVFGQTATTQVTGLVTDPTGAAVPAAIVKVTNSQTGVSRESSTNAEGYYTVPFLLPGKYDLEVRKEGFKIARQTGIVLDVERVARIDFTLSIGAVTQTVDVTAKGDALQTSTAELGTVVTQTFVANLPLNGRNFTELLTLSAGASPINDSQGGDPISGNNSPFIFNSGFVFPGMNGQSNRSNEYLMDGLANTSDTLGNYLVPPIIDAIAEFKVSSHQDQAQFGGVVGGVVNVVTKSGTNSLHGSAWEYVRNTDFDARNTFSPTRQVLNQNQYGVSIGGPFTLPKVYDGRNKSFFFFGWEGTRYVTPAQTYFQVPTASELEGNLSDFPTQIYNPFSTVPDPNNPGSFIRTPFQGNQITPSLIDQGMVTYAKDTLPSPIVTGVGSYNAVDTTPTRQDMDSFTGRFDQNFGSKNAIFFRYSEANLTTTKSGGRPEISTGQLSPVYQWVASYVRTFSPTLVLQAEFGKAHEDYNSPTSFKGLPSNFVQEVGFANSFVTGFTGASELVPQVDVPGYFSSGPGVNDATPDNTWDGKAVFTKIWGKHQLTFGGDYNTIGYVGHQGWPIVTFNPEQTGNPENSADPGSVLASFLLGVPEAAQHYNSVTNQSGGSIWDFFFQDSWKVTSRLTVNMGLRYDRTMWPIIYPKDAYGSWDLDTGNYLLQAMAPPCASVSAPPCLPGGSTLPPHVEISPDGKLVHDTPTNWGPRIGLAYRLRPNTTLRGSFGIFYDNREGINEGLNSDHGTWPQSPDSGIENNVNVPTAANPTPTVTAENPFPTGSAGGFPGPSDYYSNVSWFLSPYMKTPYSQQWNLGVEHQFGLSTVLSVNYVGSGSRRLEVGSVYNTALTPGPGAIQPRQLFPYYTQAYYDRGIGKADYNALQATLTRHYTKDLAYQVAYTYSKSMDYGCTGLYAIEGCSIQNPYDIYMDRGVSALNLTHMLSLSGVYQDPVGKGKRFDLGNSVANYIVGNWELGTVFFARSGQPFSVTVGEDVLNTGVGSVRPDVVGNPHTTDWSQYMFNPSGFAIPPLYTYGTSGRDSLRLQPSWNLDMSLIRQFPIREKVRFEFRVDAFNLFNNVVYGFNELGATTPSGLNLVGPDFGVTAAQANNPRELQFSGKIVF
jgi:outer membrane receptor protein involved in Fe transport